MENTGKQDRPGAGATIVFWMLVALAFSVLAPSLLLPEWRSCEALWEAEQVEQHRIDELGQTIAQEERRLEALRSDPATMERLARRELSYFRPDEVEIAVNAQSPGMVEPAAPSSQERRSALSGLASWLPRLNYDAVFCDVATRRLMIALSLGLLAFAFLLFCRHRAHN